MKYLIYQIYIFFKTIFVKNKFRKHNKHNNLNISELCDINCIQAGKESYGSFTVINDSTDYKLIIGNYCSFGGNVTFILSGEHYYKGISTFPLKVKKFNYNQESLSKGSIIVEDDVWIGVNTTICSGIRIGQGAIIAAGAVITKDVPPYSIVGGNPSKIIKYRFEKEIIDKLINIDITKLLDLIEKEDLDYVYTPLTMEKLNKLLTIYNL